MAGEAPRDRYRAAGPVLQTVERRDHGPLGQRYSVAIIGYARARPLLQGLDRGAIRTEFDLLERSFAYVKDETR